MNQKTTLIVVAAVAVVLVFVTVVAVAGVWIGVSLIRDRAGVAASDVLGGDWALDSGAFGRGYHGPGMMRGSEGVPLGRSNGGPGMMGGDWEEMPFGALDDPPCVEGRGGPGSMWGGDWGAMPCDEGYSVPEGGNVQSLEEAQAAVERYVQRLGYENVHVMEVMEFERNFYAIVAEEDTGIGAMELLIDKDSGAVGPEPGPNMMWNAEYGMHRGGGMGMMGTFTTGEMVVSPQEAEAIAQRWLDTNLPGRTAGEADPFYGYYTLHFLQDGEIEGMLSVHGSSGDVWYHSWHGDFVDMIGDHD
jgi:hypothetical protein